MAVMVYRPNRIKIPATIASTANAVEIVLEILVFISGNKPVRISQSGRDSESFSRNYPYRRNLIEQPSHPYGLN